MILHLKMRSDIGTGTVNEFTVGTQGRAKAGLGRFAEKGSAIYACIAVPIRGSVDEYGFMKDAMAAGYRAVMFKSNDFSCHDRAYIIRQALPDAECLGSFCMNRVHGDKVNVFAAQKAVETSGGLCRCIWMPTLDAAYQYQSEGRLSFHNDCKT